jgi:hypothetical protein
MLRREMVSGPSVASLCSIEIGLPNSKQVASQLLTINRAGEHLDSFKPLCPNLESAH